MNIQFQGRDLANIEFNADGEITASRGFDSVTIVLPLHIEVTAEPEGSTWLCDSIRMELCNGVQLLALCHFHSALQSRTAKYDYKTFAEFRCTPNAVAEYERVRNGQPVDLRIKVIGQIQEFRTGTDPKILCESLGVCAQVNFRIDKAKWTKALRDAGLSASVLVEIPFAFASTPNDDALKALSNAFESFENGGSVAWKDCVGHLRPYLEEWSKVKPTPEKEPKDGSASDREWKLLHYRDALYKCCHFWVHDWASECSRDDALLALSSFAALLKADRNPCGM